MFLCLTFSSKFFESLVCQKRVEFFSWIVLVNFLELITKSTRYDLTMYGNEPTASTEVLCLREVRSHWYCALVFKTSKFFCWSSGTYFCYTNKIVIVGVYPEPLFPHFWLFSLMYFALLFHIIYPNLSWITYCTVATLCNLYFDLCFYFIH